MKTGKIPVASIAVLIVLGVKLVIKYFFPASYNASLPIFDGILLAVVIVFLLYYIRIWVTAWLKNRSENA